MAELRPALLPCVHAKFLGFHYSFSTLLTHIIVYCKKISLEFLLHLTESSIGNHRLNCFLISVSKIVVLSLSSWFIFTLWTLNLVTDHVPLYTLAAAKLRVPAPPFSPPSPSSPFSPLAVCREPLFWLSFYLVATVIGTYLILLVLKAV